MIFEIYTHLQRLVAPLINLSYFQNITYRQALGNFPSRVNKCLQQSLMSLAFVLSGAFWLFKQVICTKGTA
jgi:hypothetical protein